MKKGSTLLCVMPATREPSKGLLCNATCVVMPSQGRNLLQHDAREPKKVPGDAEHAIIHPARTAASILKSRCTRKRDRGRVSRVCTRLARHAARNDLEGQHTRQKIYQISAAANNRKIRQKLRRKTFQDQRNVKPANSTGLVTF